MRVYFVHILKSDLEDYPEGTTICYPGHNSPYSGKGERRTMFLATIKKREDGSEYVDNKREVETVVGLGYKDFKNEEDYEKRAPEVIKQKLIEVGLE